MTRKARWTAIVGLTVTAAASMSFGVSSGGSRGLVFGLAVPVACIFVAGFLTDMLVAMLAGLVAGVVGTAIAGWVGGNLDDSPDAVINLLPLLSILLLLGAAAAGMLCRLLSDYLADRSRTRRPETR